MIPAKGHDSREEISANIVGTQITKDILAAPNMGQLDTSCSQQTPPEESLGIVKMNAKTNKKKTEGKKKQKKT